MKLSPSDWQKLQFPVLLLLVTLIASIALVSFAINDAQTQMLALKQEEDTLLVAKQKYLSSGAERQKIEHYLPKYQALITQGFIGEEQRQRWIDALYEIQQSHQLFPITYKLSPLEQKNPAFINTVKPFEMHVSTMQLSLDLLHELDLLTLTEALQAKNLQHWLLSDCALQRLQNKKPNGASMTAQCTIEWYTLQEPRSK